MLKRNPDIESTIRDSKFLKIEFQFQHYSESEKNNIGNSIKFSFIKFDKELIELVLINPQEVYLFEDYQDEYISHIKVSESENSFEISFDPYDEAIKEINEETDNYVFKSESYTIASKQI
ncbi:MAG: hypothetical protein ACRBCS_02220 [Cellvibrionaceae bacterium]